MRGIILAGGRGTRLAPLTKTTNKSLLPIYDKHLICYPIDLLKSAGIKNILLISGGEHIGGFIELLEDGSEFGVDFTYKVQNEPIGIAHGLSLAKDFVRRAGTIYKDESIVFVLGDNIFFDDLSSEISNFKDGAKVFLKEVHDPQRFGVPVFEDSRIVRIEEKPKNPQNNFAVTGLYLFGPNVFDFIPKLKRSERGLYEITDLLNIYAKWGQLDYYHLKKEWVDAGTFDSLLKANILAKEKQND